MPDKTPSVAEHDYPGRNMMTTMREEIDRLFEDFAHRTPASWFGADTMLPTVDVSESEDAVDVMVELPGVEEKDIDIDVSGDILTIRGEKKKEEEEKKKHFHRIERRYGSFQRSMRIPFQIDADQVRAVYDKGVLRVSLAKPAEVKKRSHKIEVKSGK
jgi:HSP20 family protein